MAYLLDTQVIIWLSREPQKVVQNVVDIVMQKSEKIYFSDVSIWEVAIKSKLKKLL